jgi:hypothetical protein
MHVYMYGNDPFVFVLGDVTVYVHAGAPTGETTVSQPVVPGRPTGQSSGHAIWKTRWENPSMIAPAEFGDDATSLADRLDSLATASESDQLDVLVDSSAAAWTSDRFATLIAGLGRAESSDVAIHLVEGADRDG